jgi:hypothetical protein
MMRGCGFLALALVSCLAVSGCYRGVGEGDGFVDETVASEPCESDDDCDNPCAISVCGPDLVCVPQQAIVSNECRPEIEVDHPARGATLLGSEDDARVTVTGVVRSGAAPISSLTLNGESVKVEKDGRFSHDVSAHVGGNVLVFETTDVLEQSRKRVQSFLWSTDYVGTDDVEDGMVEHGLAFWLDQEVIDDKDDSPPYDDLASVLNLVLGNLDISTLYDSSKPVLQHSGYDVYIQDLWFDDSAVRMNARDQGLDLAAGLLRTEGKIYYHCTCSGLSCPCWYAGGSSHGGFSIRLVRFDGEVRLSVDAEHRLTTDIRDMRTRVEDIKVWSNKGWTNFIIQAFMYFVEDQVASRLETELTRAVRQEVGPALENTLSDLALAIRFAFPSFSDESEPIAVNLVADFLATDFHDGVAPPEPSPPRGGGIAFRAGAHPAAPRTPYQNSGVPLRAGCGQGQQPLSLPRENSIELAISDDVINAFLHAGWRGGLLEFPLQSATQDVQISGMLAPTISDCGPTGQLRAHIGDVRIDATVNVLGQTIPFQAHVSLALLLEISLIDGSIALEITGVDQIEIELTATDDGNIGREPALVELLEQQLVDNLVGQLQDGLGGFDVPAVDLSSAIGLPPGTAVLNVQIDDLVRHDGTILAVGSL